MRSRVFMAAVVVLAMAGCSSTDVCFSPNGACSTVLLEEFGFAEESIHAAVYCFTNETVAEGLAEAHMRGVEVQVALDSCDNFNLGVQDYLDGQDVPVRVSNNPDGGIMHDKFAVIDGKVVLTGSYNWTSNAESRNDENLVRLVNSEMAVQFEDEFERLWTRGD